MDDKPKATTHIKRSFKWSRWPKRLVKLKHGISIFSCSQTRPTGYCEGYWKQSRAILIARWLMMWNLPVTFSSYWSFRTDRWMICRSFLKKISFLYWHEKSEIVSEFCIPTGCSTVFTLFGATIFQTDCRWNWCWE